MVATATVAAARATATCSSDVCRETRAKIVRQSCSSWLLLEGGGKMGAQACQKPLAPLGPLQHSGGGRKGGGGNLGYLAHLHLQHLRHLGSKMGKISEILVTNSGPRFPAQRSRHNVRISSRIITTVVHCQGGCDHDRARPISRILIGG